MLRPFSARRKEFVGARLAPPSHDLTDGKGERIETVCRCSAEQRTGRGEAFTSPGFSPPALIKLGWLLIALFN
jgi:hypothetical protein